MPAPVASGWSESPGGACTHWKAPPYHGAPPNHSFRHYLKSVLLDRDVPERISDAITGHKTPGIGRKYEHVSMSKKFDAISKLPVIPLVSPTCDALS